MTIVPLLIALVVGCFCLVGLHMVLQHLERCDARRQVKLDEAYLAHVALKIDDLDRKFGKALAPILDDIGQIKTKNNINQLL